MEMGNAVQYEWNLNSRQETVWCDEYRTIKTLYFPTDAPIYNS